MNIRLFSLFLVSSSVMAQTPPAAENLPIPAIPPIIIPDVISKTPEHIAFESKLPARLDPSNGLRK